MRMATRAQKVTPMPMPAFAPVERPPTVTSTPLVGEGSEEKDGGQ